MQAFYIPSASMDDTLVRERPDPGAEGQLLGRRRPRTAGTSWCSPTRAAGSTPPRRRPPSSPVARGLELVGLYPTGGHLVKRVIGVGGDEVKCCDSQGRITVNGVPLERDVLPRRRREALDDRLRRQGPSPATSGCRATTAPTPPTPGCTSATPAGDRCPVDDVVGKVFAVVWPLGHAKTLHTPGHRSSRAVPPPERGRSVHGPMSTLPRGLTVRKDAGLYGYERALRRVGLDPVAGVDEAGRGACAGPLVAAAVVLPDGRRGQVPGLADSKLLTAQARERAYVEVLRRALAWSVVVVEHRGVRPARHARRQRRGAAPVARAARRTPVVRADRRLPRRRPRGARAGDLEGRPGGGLHRGRVGDRQGDPGPDHDAGCTSEYPVYDFVTHKGYITADAHRGARASTGRARSTGAGSSTCAGRGRGCRRRRCVRARGSRTRSATMR